MSYTSFMALPSSSREKPAETPSDMLMTSTPRVMQSESAAKRSSVSAPPSLPSSLSGKTLQMTSCASGATPMKVSPLSANASPSAAVTLSSRPAIMPAT